jgi:hypothetical protein
MSSNILSLMSNKVIQRFYGNFLKNSYFGSWKKWFLQLCQKLQSLVKKSQGILEVELELQTE